jgi:hypothetical protein
MSTAERACLTIWRSLAKSGRAPLRHVGARPAYVLDALRAVYARKACARAVPAADDPAGWGKTHDAGWQDVGAVPVRAHGGACLLFSAHSAMQARASPQLNRLRNRAHRPLG